MFVPVNQIWEFFSFIHGKLNKYIAEEYKVPSLIWKTVADFLYYYLVFNSE